MMFNQKFVASIKVDGKILREFKDTVYVKFGSEYAICLKNLHSTRAIVNVYIDGENIVPGGLVLNAGQTIDLERSIKNGNLTEGAKLKFIERTAGIEQHRGIKMEDGIISVEYHFEKYVPPVLSSPFYSTPAPLPTSRDIWCTTNTSATFNVNGALRSVDYSKGESAKMAASSAMSDYLTSQGINATCTMHDGVATMDCHFNDAGITVAGSKSTQSFVATTIGTLEDQKHTIVLKLLGETPNNVPVIESVTVKTKQECPTCGKKNKATTKFCSECGTSLIQY